MDRIEFLRRNQRVLEGLFPPGWFLSARRQHHPAYLRWDFCRTLIERNGMLRFPEQAAEFPLLGRILLDSAVLVALTRGDPGQLTLGNIDLLGDGPVQQKIRSRLPDSNQYEDVMVELSTAASLQTRGYQVRLVEREGHPDLHVHLPRRSEPLLVECKRLSTDSPDRLHRHIKKADQQLAKGHAEVGGRAYGVLVLDASPVVSAGRVVDDALPPVLETLLGRIELELASGRRPSIGTVLVLWDDYMVLGTPPERTMVAFRRRVRRLSQLGSIRAVPDDEPLVEGWTVTYTLIWGPPNKRIRQVAFSELFEKEFQRRFHLSRSHVAEALDKFDKEDVVILDSHRELLLRSRLIRASREFYMLVGAERTTDLTTVLWVFRLGSELGEDLSVLSPLQLLERFAGVYGLPITIGDLTAHFILMHRIPVTPQGNTPLIGIRNPDNHPVILCSMLRLTQEREGQFWTDCAVAFCVDTTRYSG